MRRRPLNNSSDHINLFVCDLVGAEAGDGKSAVLGDVRLTSAASGGQIYLRFSCAPARCPSQNESSGTAGERASNFLSWILLPQSTNPIYGATSR